MLYRLDSDFCILVMESGASVTIADALEYLAMDIRVVTEKPVAEHSEEADTKSEGDDEESETKSDPEDDPNLPKVSDY